MIKGVLSYILGCGLRRGDLVRYTTSRGVALGNVHRVINVKFICGTWWVEFEDRKGHHNESKNYKKLKENKKCHSLP